VSPRTPRQHWPRFIAGEIVGKWPLYLQVSVDNMFTAYGSAHQRLRRLISPALAREGSPPSSPSVEENTVALLDELDSNPGRTVDRIWDTTLTPADATAATEDAYGS
jgi:cytochrome P450